MEIAQQIRDFAKERGISEAAAFEAGLAEKAQEYRAGAGVRGSDDSAG